MKSSYNNIYDKCPIWIQNFLISLYGYKLVRERFGKTFKKYYKEYFSKSYLNLKEEEENQIKELKKIVNYAKEKSKFYKEFYKNINVNEIKSIEDLKKLPILEKEIFRENLESIYTIDSQNGITSFTGGTTGKSLMVIYTKDDFQKRQAYLAAFKGKLGIIKGMKMATFSGRQFTQINQEKKVFWRYNHAMKQKLYSTFNMTNENLRFYIQDLNEFKPQTLNGFVSAIYDLAKYINDNKMQLLFKPLGIFTTSETLLSYHRELIEKVFKCKVYDQYASSEGAPFICECKEGNLHYNLDTGVIEELETEHGSEMLVTSFTTYGTPLIRYRIGDKIELSKERCKCGSVHPVVKKIEGRQVDYLLTSENGKVSLSHLADVIKGLPNCIQNMQFIQNKLDEIDIKIIVDKKKYKDCYEEMILTEMKYRFGERTKFNIILVDNIEKEKSGKYRLIKNYINKGEK